MFGKYRSLDYDVDTYLFPDSLSIELVQSVAIYDTIRLKNLHVYIFVLYFYYVGDVTTLT